MGIIKKYKMWRRFNDLMDHWDYRLHKLKDIPDNYRPRKRTDFLRYGKVIGELDCIKDSLRLLDRE